MGKAATNLYRQRKKEGYAVAGITRDGVAILKVGPATHFTEREVDAAINRILKRESASGKIAGSKR
jgi:tagatose-1,6-bisphosphate aldolase non-catalytic subunit AgaZ/GatZ